MWLFQDAPQKFRRSASLAACVSGVLETLNLALAMVVSTNSVAGYFLGFVTFICYGPLSVGVSLIIAHVYLVPVMRWTRQRWGSGPLIAMGAVILLLIAVGFILYFHQRLQLDLFVVLFPYFLYLGVFFSLCAYSKTKALAGLATGAIIIATLVTYSRAVNSHTTFLLQLYPDLENRVSHVRMSDPVSEGAYLYRFKIAFQDLTPIITKWELEPTDIEVCSDVLTEEGGSWVGWSHNQLTNSSCYEGDIDFYLSYNSVSQIAYMVHIRT